MADPNDIIIDETVDDQAGLAPALTKSDVDEMLTDDKVLPRGAELNGDKSVTVTLDYPVTLDIKGPAGVRQERFEKLTLHRLTGADLNALNAAAKEHQDVVLFSRSSRLRSAIAQALYQRMDGADIGRCGKVLNTFL